MKLAFIKEKFANENRVAVTPDIAALLSNLDIEVHMEKGAGVTAGFPDSEYKEAGVKISANSAKALSVADIIFKVQPPTATNIVEMKKGAIMLGLLGSAQDKALVKKYSENNISAFAMEFVPRITRAQSMDVLSSQSNIAGYKAVIDAVAEFGKVVPMMMTAAGTIKPTRFLILGAGVAGLQAIATAKRLGGVVSAFDVRSAAKEQVESLGASFVEVESKDGETGDGSGGYAKEMSEAYKKKQSELIHQCVKGNDIIICTALIPGKPAPVLVTEKMAKDMRPGSVIVDMATVAGGNCAISEKDKIIEKHGVKIIGHSNIAARVPYDASRLYARNLYNFIEPMVNKKLKKIKIDFEDEIIQNCLLTHDGRIVHKLFQKQV